MKYNNFEKHISESFLHDSAAVDTDALIASLGIPVALEPKKKIAWWLLTSIALLSLLVVGLYYFVNTSKGNYIEDSGSSILTDDNWNGNNNGSSLLVAEHDEAIGENKAKEEITIVDVVVNDEIEEIVATTEVTGSIIASDISYVEVDTQVDYVTNDTGKKLNASKVIEANSEPSQFISTTSTVRVSNSANTIVNDRTVINKEVGIVNSAVKNRSAISLLPIDIVESQVVSMATLPGLAEPECPSFSYRIPWNIALLAEVGVMKPMKNLENIGGSNSVFDLRDRNETSKEAIQIGLHAKISKGSNPLYVRGGAAYTRIAEQMNEEYDYIEMDTMRGLISITTSMTGDTVTAIYGDVISETRYTGRSEKHYYLHLIDIPVAIGYEIPITGSFYAGAEVGVQFNLRTSGSGLIFRDTNDYAELSEVTTKETKVGMSYFGGFHFGKHLSKRSSIQLSARFRYYPSKFSTVDPTIEQRYNLAGLHAGYVFRF